MGVLLGAYSEENKNNLVINAILCGNVDGGTSLATVLRTEMYVLRPLT